MRVRSIAMLPLVALCLSGPGCSKSNNLFLGRVESKLGSHVVIVTDCYRTSVPPPETLRSESGRPSYRFKPCLDADVRIEDDQLTVNGVSYGKLSRTDTVIVDHGKVLINDIAAAR